MNCCPSLLRTSREKLFKHLQRGGSRKSLNYSQRVTQTIERTLVPSEDSSTAGLRSREEDKIAGVGIRWGWRLIRPCGEKGRWQGRGGEGGGERKTTKSLLGGEHASQRLHEVTELQHAINLFLGLQRAGPARKEPLIAVWLAQISKRPLPNIICRSFIS